MAAETGFHFRLSRSKARAMQCVAQLRTSWRDPVEVLSAFAGEPWAIGFVSGGGGPRGR